MQYFQSNNRVIIISNDNFIVGLLTGYCAANHLTVQCEPRTTPFSDSVMKSECKLIIIDLRQLAVKLIDAHLKTLKMINHQYAIPICAIHNHNSIPLFLMKPWINYYKYDTFIDELETHITKYVSNFVPAFVDRRNDERRHEHERRKLKEGRRGLGIERRMSLGDVTASHQLSQTAIADCSDEHDILGVFEINHNCHSVYLRGADLHLTCKEYKLFNLLAKDVERVCTTEKIIEHLWPNKRRANKSDLYQYMYLLRKKVEFDPDHPYWILTIKGVGYKLNVVATE